MNKFFKILTFAFSLVIIFSCSSKRDDDGDLLFGKNNNPNEGGTTTGKLLTKITGTDADGTHTTETFTYANGKLTGVKFEEEGVVTTYTIAYEMGLMSKINSHKVEGTDVEDGENILHYTNGKLTSTTGTLKSGNTTFDYSTAISYDTSGKVTRILKSTKIGDLSQPGSLVLARTLEEKLTYNSNNVAAWEYNVSTYNNNVPTVVYALKTSLSDYDTKKNPFSLLPMAYTLTTSSENPQTNSILGLSANNYKKAVVSFLGMTSNQVVNYTYNSDGYPITATNQDGNVIKFDYQ